MLIKLEMQGIHNAGSIRLEKEKCVFEKPIE